MKARYYLTVDDNENSYIFPQKIRVRRSPETIAFSKADWKE